MELALPTQLSITLTHSANSIGSQISIDRQSVTIASGKGVYTAPDGQHNFVIWLEGPSGCTASFSIDAGGKTFAKGMTAVSNGHSTAVCPGTFPTP